ncbi:MAG: hypothetical protein ND895_03750, partial [Pyrinomonadaceae bacterium]|nr:hypothetical protein [Pyrinomonadaceae bacterium]
ASQRPKRISHDLSRSTQRQSGQTRTQPFSSPELASATSDTVSVANGSTTQPEKEPLNTQNLPRVELLQAG